MLIKLFNFLGKYFFAIFALSVIFVLSSILWTSDVHYYQDTKANIQLGFPLNFYSQDHSQEDIYFMTKDRKEGFMWSSNTVYPSSFHWSLFFANIIIVQTVFTSILFFVYSSVPRADYFFRFLSVKYIFLALFLFLAVIIGQKFIPIGGEQIQDPGAENPVILPHSFSDSIPTPRPAN